MQTKYNPLDQCEIKLKKSGTGQFEGYASTFGNVDSYGDIVEKGAFAETLESKSQIMMFHSHDPRSVIGKWLDAKEDDHGLLMKGEFTPGHTLAQDTYASVKHGAVGGLSIGFMIAKDGATYDDESDTRRLTNLKLLETSIVGIPANDKALITGVKFWLPEDGFESLRDAETILRDAGFSKSAALAFVSRIRNIARRDADVNDADELKRTLKTAATKADLELILKR